VLPLPSPPLLR